MLRRGIGVVCAEPRMGIGARQRRHQTGRTERVPARQQVGRSIQQGRNRTGRAECITDHRPRQRRTRLVAPAAVGVDPLKTIDGNVPRVPAQRGPRRVGMRGNPPSRCTSSSTSAASPANGYGVAGRPRATRCPAAVLSSTASITNTPWRYWGGSGGRVPSPWSVTMMNCSPARSAACAISSMVPLPSDRSE